MVSAQSFVASFTCLCVWQCCWIFLGFALLFHAMPYLCLYYDAQDIIFPTKLAMLTRQFCVSGLLVLFWFLVVVLFLLFVFCFVLCLCFACFIEWRCGSLTGLCSWSYASAAIGFIDTP